MDDVRLETEQEEGQEQDGHLGQVRLMVCVSLPLIAADAPDMPMP